MDGKDCKVIDMKKTIGLILIAWVMIVNSHAQTKDAEAHFAFGTFAGVAASGCVWQKTGNRWLSATSGIVASAIIGVAKETYDQNNDRLFSKRDLKNTLLGGLTGTLSFHLILGRKSIHQKNIPIQDRWKIDELTKL